MKKAMAVDANIDRALAEFRQSDIVIAGLATTYLPLVIQGVDDRNGYIAVREARLEVKGLRVKVEHKRKELKEDALKYGKAVDAEANRLKALMEPIEEHLKTQEDEYEAAREKIKAEKAEAAELVLQARVQRLTEARCPLPDIAFLRDVDADNFEPFFSKAVEVQAEKERLAQVESDRVAAEQAVIKAEADRIEAAAKAERERLAAEQQAELLRQQEVNRIESARLKAEADRIKAEQQAEQSRHAELIRIDRERMDADRAELKRQAEELRLKQEADRQRIEAENEEARHQRDEEIRKADEAETERQIEAERAANDLENWERGLLNLTCDYCEERDCGMDVLASEALDQMYDHWRTRPQQ